MDGSICPKGQAGLQTAYDPYRIRKVLKHIEPERVTITTDCGMKALHRFNALAARMELERRRAHLDELYLALED